MFLSPSEQYGSGRRLCRSWISRSSKEIVMIRRIILIAAAVVAVMPIAALSQQQPLPVVHAFPDARFVGFAQTVNDFEIKSGQLALQKSQNELVRSYVSYKNKESTENAQNL